MSMSALHRLKLITFDVNGVLIKINNPIGETYSKIAKSHGILADSRVLNKNFLHSWTEMNLSFPNYGFGTDIDSYQWWKILVLKTFRASISAEEYNFNEKKLEEMTNSLYKQFATTKQWELVVGSKDLLEYLKSSKMGLGIISNFDERLEGLLKCFGLYNYFDFIISSYQVGLHKPDPKIFQLAKQMYKDKKFQNIKCCEALHVGDSTKLDFDAAKNAGWEAALITNSANLIKMSKNKLIFENLQDFYTFCKQR